MKLHEAVMIHLRVKPLSVKKRLGRSQVFDKACGVIEIVLADTNRPLSGDIHFGIYDLDLTIDFKREFTTIIKEQQLFWS